MQKAPPTPKGFRDITPNLAKKRRDVINKIVEVLEEFEFVPIETPTIEFAQTLKGKYGEEEKLIYQFKDRGGRELALRFDLTVPLARFVASNPNLKMPFSRYQVGQVFRGENPQHGRYREFTQLDFDTVGFNQDSLKYDAQIILATLKASQKIGLVGAKIFINHRSVFDNIPQNVTRAIDKIYKVGKEGVIKELESDYPQEKVEEYLVQVGSNLQNQLKDPGSDLAKILKIFKEEKDYQSLGDDLVADANLARGLDYYTGTIFELKPSNNPLDLSIGAGGRYDNLIRSFVHPAKGGKTNLPAGRQVPAVGFSFGLDRLIEALP